MKSTSSESKPKPKNPRGRPKTRDIMNLQQTIPTTPEELTQLIFSTPPNNIN